MEFKTSTKISIKFTIFTVILVFLFGIVINIVFFQKWFSPMNREINNISSSMNTSMITNRHMMFKSHFNNNLKINVDSPEHKLLIDSQIINNIANIDEKYFYFKEIGHDVFILDITKQIMSQINLLYITLYGLIIFGILSYVLSLYFVKSSLDKLNKLVEYMKNLNLENIDKKIEIEGHPYDEINMLSNKINQSLDKIHKQTLSLKDFITNASHELKTPLMAINSEIDYAIKSKKYKDGLDNIKIELKSFNNLLDELVLITKFDSIISLDKKSKNILNIIDKNIKDISKKYKNKKINVTKNMNKITKKVHNSSFDIISKNLIENAFKYTDTGTINIILNNKEFIIKDTGMGIEKKNLNNIRDRFWQGDSSKSEIGSFGLGLYLTKLLVEKHGRKIKVNSKKGKGSEFKIIF